MVESLIDMGRCFFWSLTLLVVTLITYLIIKNPSPPFMAVVGVLVPVSGIALVSAAIGAYLGSQVDSLFGIGHSFATAGIVAGLAVGIAMWLRKR